MNKIILVGRWTKDTELKFAPGNGTAILKGTLAVDRQYKKEGEQSADYFNITAWGKKAEATANNCGSKGKLVAVCGWMKTGKHDSKKYPGAVIPDYEVQAEDIQFLSFDKKPSSGSGNDMTLSDDPEIPFF